MSVRLRKWTTKEGKVLERWTIDVKVALSGTPPRRIRDFSPVNTRRGAEQHEHLVREALLAGTLGKEVKEVPTLEAFQERFIDYSLKVHRHLKGPYVFCEMTVLASHTAA